MSNALADRATSDMLIGPDWALNLEICDILNHDPGQAREFVKGLKKRIRSKNPKVQLLALTLLETVVKNCGDMVQMHIADKDIPHEMVKIVKKKPDFHVKEKILVLIYAWQKALGGSQGRYPQFFMAYHDLLRAGVVFPKRPAMSTPIFTPTHIRPSVLYPHRMRNYEKKTEKLEIECDSQTHVLSLADILHAQVIMNVLAEMLYALEQGNKEDVKQQVMVELVEQCRQYRQRVVHLVNSTSEEELLCKGLALNDDLQNVLSKYDYIFIEVLNRPKKQKSLEALVDIDDENQEDDNESDERSNTGGSASNKALLQQLLLPSPLSNDMPALSPRSAPQVDLLSGENFGTSLMDDSLGFPVEQAYTVGSQFQQQQRSLPSLDGSVMEHGQSKFEQASFVQRAQSEEVDQGGALPPPPWEIELSEISQTLTLQQQPQQNEQTGEIITYSPIIPGNQPVGIRPPNDQASYFSNSYSQPMYGGQMEIYDYGQQSESQLYGYNASYYYSNNNELSHILNGVSLQDRCQMVSTATPYLQQPMKPLRADDDLFADLVSMVKSKTNKSSN